MPRVAGETIAMTGLALEEVRADDDRALAEKATRAFYRGSSNWRVPLFAATLRVVSVQEGSPAAALKVQPGDVLMAAILQDRFGRERDMRLDSLRDFASLLQQFQGRTVRLVVLRGDDDLVGALDVRSLDDGR
jgi:C-terminal processing protease CtpA/Prc